MISTTEIKFIQSLRLKKNRDKNHMFVAEGEKIVSELLSSELQIQTVYATQSWIERNNSQIPSDIECKQTGIRQLERISSQKTPNQVLAIVKKPNYIVNEEIFIDNLVLVLDRIQDPGNLGTIIRTADWFGVRHIICTDGTADVYNPKVIQASMGSFIRVKTYYSKPNTLLTGLSGKIPVYGAFLEGKKIYKTLLQTPAILVIGNESQGVSSELAPYISHKLTIPPYVQSTVFDKAESLNASVAAGIIMAHFRNCEIKITKTAT